MTTKISSDNIQSATLNTLGGPKITTIGYPGNVTAADPSGGQTITLTGSGFEAGAGVIIDSTSAGVVSVVSANTITFTSPALATGSYPVYVVNTNGGTAIAVPGIQYSGVPTWSTAAGSIGNVYETTNFANTVTATSDSTITYSLYSGTLPTGASLNSANGLISGTSVATASPTTYTFTIRATDLEQQETDRQFSLTVNPDVVTWSSPANNATITSNVNSALSNVTLSATSAAGYGITYTANTLPTGLSISGANIVGTPTVAANTTTLFTATAATTNRTATRTVNWVISVTNDIYYNYTTLLLNGEVGSTYVWNDDASTNKFAITVNGDTRPSTFSPYKTVWSNYFDGSGDFLTVPTNAVFNFGTADFTVEAWLYYISGDGAFFGGTAGGATDLVYYANSFRFGRYNAAWDTIINYTMTAYRWYHVVFIKESGVAKVYVNGLLAGSASNTNAYDTNGGTMRINVSGDDSRQFNGYISNLRVVKGTAVYTANFIPPTSPLTAIANTSLLTCQSYRFIDNSVNNFTITVSGNSTVSGFGPFVETNITTGSGYFDGTGDSLVASSNAAFQFGTADFTVEFWLNTTDTDFNIVGLNIAGTGNWMAVVAASGFFWQNAYATANLFSTSATSILNGLWHHVAVTRLSGTTRVYFDGVSQTSASDSTNYNGGGALQIGSGANGDLIGYISNLRIVKGTAVYTSAFTPPTSQLTAIANTSLLTLQYRTGENNNRFVDSSGMNNIITRNGNTTQGTFTPYSQTGWSNFFDGTGDYLRVSSTGEGFSSITTFTYECWICPTSALTTNCIFDINESQPFRFVLTSSNVVWQATGAGSTILTATFTWIIGAWHHVVFVRDVSGNISIFINGTRYATANYGSWGSTGVGGVNIGCNRGDTWFFPGFISNARFVKGTAVYDPTQTTITVPTSPLTAIAGTSLLTCQSNRTVDNSANNLTITINGDVSVQSFSPFGPAIITPTSYSGYFDGTGDYLTISPNASVAFDTGDFTVEMWVYMSTDNTNRALIETRATDLSANGFVFAIEATGGRFLMVFSNSKLFTTSNSISLNVWTHVALTRTGTTMRCFINGVQGASVTNSQNYTNTAFTIGAGIYASSEFNGYISNLRLLKGTALYTSNFTPPTAPLTAIANTGLLTLQSSRFIDNSTNNFTITSFGNTISLPFNPFGNTSLTLGDAAYSVTNVGGSMYFDGTGDFLTANYSINWATFGTYTLEFWVYHTTISTLNSYAYASTGSAGYTNFYVYGSGGAYPAAVGVGIQGTNEIRTANNIITTNQWIHIAYTYDGTTTRIYINGVQQASSTTAVYSNNSANLSIANGLSGSLFVGYMAGFRLLRGIRVYTSSFAAPAAPLTSIQGTSLLLSGTNSGIIDYTSKNILETIGNAKTSTSIVKYGSRSLYFDGTGDYLSIPNSQNFVFGSGNWTIELWVYLNATSRQGFTTLGNAGGTNVPWELGVGSAGKFRLLVQTSAGQYIIDGTTTPTTGIWYHVAGVRNGNTATLYVNGISEASNSSLSTNSLTAESNAVQVGTYSYGFELNGYIDDLRITKGYARYTTNFTPPTELLTY